MSYCNGWQRLSAGIGVMLVLALSGPVAGETHARPANDAALVLLSLEWPPYTGSKLSGNGEVSKHVRAAYQAQGRGLKIGFFEWRRALRLPYTDHRFTGVFPVYPAAERKAVCHLSEPIGASPVGIAQRRQRPLTWSTIDGLERYTMGTVDAYVNEDRFDALVKAGKIRSKISASDTDNLLLLAQGKIDGAIIDSRVFDWLLRNEPRLRRYRNTLQMHERLLGTWPLYVCFRKDPEGAADRDLFNAGLLQLQNRKP